MRATKRGSGGLVQDKSEFEGTAHRTGKEFSIRVSAVHSLLEFELDTVFCHLAYMNLLIRGCVNTAS